MLIIIHNGLINIYRDFRLGKINSLLRLLHWVRMLLKLWKWHILLYKIMELQVIMWYLNNNTCYKFNNNYNHHKITN